MDNTVSEDMTKLNVTPAKSIHDLENNDNVVSHNFDYKDEIVEIEDIIIVQRDVDYRVNALIMTEDHPVYQILGNNLIQNELLKTIIKMLIN